MKAMGGMAVWAGPPMAPQEAPSDDEILKKAKLGKDGPALLEYFRKRTLVDADRNRMHALIHQLGDDNFELRELASGELIALGSRALPYLREAEKVNADADVEVLRRAEQCRVLIEGEAGAMVSAAAARVVGKLKPAGAAPVLLAYLPYAEDAAVADELRGALVQVAVQGGKVDGALVKGLEDRLAVKRAAAAEVLCRAGVTAELPAIHKLLKDKDPTVCLRAAVNLVAHQDKDAVPTLITLLTRLDEDQASEAEDVLFRVAGEKAPTVELGADADARKKCSEEWAKWWKQHAGQVDLAKYGKPPALRNFTLLVQRDFIWRGGRGPTGKVQEIGPDKKVRWKIEGLSYPVDAQVLPNDHVLITEYQGRKVTERDLKGKVLWEHSVNGWPLSAQRLPNGNTFIVMQNQLLEVNKNHTEVSSIHRGSDVVKALKLRNGDIALVTNQNRYIRLDAKGNELKNFPLNGGVQMFGSFDVLPSGRVLVPLTHNGRVVEYTPTGKVLWSLEGLQWPTAVVRLPNGQTVVACQNSSQVFIYNRQKKLVWHYNADGQVFQARRR
jgi:HEAT repeat protein